jgi:hypothetical protein
MLNEKNMLMLLNDPARLKIKRDNNFFPFQLYFLFLSFFVKYIIIFETCVNFNKMWTYQSNVCKKEKVT